MTTTLLPAIPDNPGEVTAQDVYELEEHVKHALPEIDDLRVLAEWEKKADSVATYLSKHDLRGPAMGIQRRIEARIGQLLSEPHRGKKTEQKTLEQELFPHEDFRNHCRHLARALSGEIKLPNDKWQQPRKVLVRQIRDTLGDKPKPVRRRNSKQSPRDSTGTLESVIKNAADSAEFAAELATSETIEKLSTEQCNAIITSIGKAITNLTDVAKQIRAKKGK